MKTKVQNQGGNPALDMKAAVERYNTIVEPVFLNQGFKRVNRKNHILINDTSRVIVFVTSAPSQRGQSNDFKVKIKEYRKQYKGYSPYILFTRDYSEWNSKTVYVETLKRIIRIPNLSGIVTGLGNLTQLLKSTKNGEPLYMIG